RRLELELRRFGAPSSFARRAQRARADEINHARDTARLARRFGATVPAVDIAPMGPRDLVAFALENAVEGAVRETYGALVAAFQAERASPELRPLLRRIARDEARHAELAHDIDRWVQPKLFADERALIAAVRAEALADLRAASAFEPDESVARIAGVPTAAEARILLDGLDREILAAA
ncbi:MAG: putative lipoprotein, partial [Myxococcaceae bacterium]|nr:putative lipoprotein [Myxococcaceae bacterium]